MKTSQTTASRHEVKNTDFSEGQTLKEINLKSGPFSEDDEDDLDLPLDDDLNVEDLNLDEDDDF